MLLVAPGGHVHYTAFRKCRKTHSFRQLDKNTHTFKYGIPKPNSKFRGGFGFKCKGDKCKLDFLELAFLVWIRC